MFYHVTNARGVMVAVSNLAALRCTCSNWVMPSLVYGSHTEQAYSSDGRTKDLYACSLTLVELMLMFLRRNLSVLLVFVVMLFIWLSHLRSDCIVTPRYFKFKLVSVKGVCVFYWCFISCDG